MAEVQYAPGTTIFVPSDTNGWEAITVDSCTGFGEAATIRAHQTAATARGGSSIEKWQAFPAVLGSQHAQVLEFSEVKKRDCERSALWGWINEVPYHNRGWCAAEFSCARKAGIIANLDDPDVQKVLKARDWPEDVAEYEKMMENTKIEFTAKGDRDYVAYLFFKMSSSAAAAVINNDSPPHRWFA